MFTTCDCSHNTDGHSSFSSTSDGNTLAEHSWQAKGHKDFGKPHPVFLLDETLAKEECSKWFNRTNTPRKVDPMKAAFNQAYLEGGTVSEELSNLIEIED